MKTLQILFLFAIVVAFAYATNSTWGRRVRGDTLLYNQTFRVSGRPGVAQTIEVAFPGSGQTNRKIISVIYANDTYPKNLGAYATLWSGGQNYTFTKINLKSQVGQGINTTVAIFGK